MGVVHLAFDREIKREVALKTIRDIRSEPQLQLFYKECELLKSISHPNIVELFDMGVFEDEEGQRPYFVMPLLRGVTLQELIRTSSRRLTVPRSVDIISQACKGLQAAHEAGLVHRDVKPSNLFVLEDDSVKIIDFGIARVADVLSESGFKGTLKYMSPEQIQMKPVSAASDIFSLGVVAYETLTRRRPFGGQTDSDLIDAIEHFIPPPVSTLNPELNQALGHVIHKAIAKKPYHRFATAREFSESLQKAMRNEPLEIFDPARIQPRIQRATRAFEQGDYQFASEILEELESEGHIDPAISTLRRRVEQVVRQKRIQRFIDGARSRFEEGEYPLALQKVQEALGLDPDNAEAIALRQTIESKRTVEKIEDWFRLARQHLDNYSFDHARQAVENVLQIDPENTLARKLVVDVQRKEQDYLKVRQEKDRLYHVAQESWQKGDVTNALSKLERVLQLERQAPERSVPGRENSYLALYNEVRSEHDLMNNSYAEGRRHLAERSFPKAKAVCDQFLAKYPGNALFQALRFDIAEQERQEGSAFIAETDRRVEAEPNLERRVAILEEALQRCPGEPHFERALRLMKEKRDFVRTIVARANLYEEQGQFVEAIGQWEILQTVYREYPGLAFEIERLTKRRDHKSRVDEKARWVEQIDQSLEVGDYAHALELGQAAQAEFPNDAELAQLEKLAREGIERGEEAQRLLAEAQELCNQRQFEKGIQTLRRAYKLDERNPALRRFLADALVEQARTVIDDGKSAEELIQQALELDPSHVQARGFRTLIQDRKKHEYIDQVRAEARQLQNAGDIRGALQAVDAAIARFQNEPQLTQIRTNLERILGEDRKRDLDRLRQMAEDAEATSHPTALTTLSEKASDLARNYPDDQEVKSLVTKIRRKTRSAIPADRSAIEDNLAATEILPPKQSEPIGTASSLVDQAKAWVKTIGSRIGAAAGSPSRRKSRETVDVDEKTVRMEVPFRVRAALALRAVRRRPVLWISTFIVVAGVIIAVPVVKNYRSAKNDGHGTPRKPQEVLVTIEHVPSGTVIRIGDTIYTGTGVKLSPGQVTVNATLDGYRPIKVPVDISPDSPSFSWRLPDFEPLGATLQVTGAQPDMSLDDSPLHEAEKKDLGAGHHILKFTRPAEAQIEFDASPRSLPQVASLEKMPQDLFAAVICTYENAARVALQRAPKTYRLLQDTVPQVDLTESVKTAEAALIAESLPRGEYTLILGEGETSQVVEFEVASFPIISIQISELTAGTAVISAVTATTKEPIQNVRIYVDDIPQADLTNKDGKMRVSLAGGIPHKLRAEPPEAYQPSSTQTALIPKGGYKRVTFTFAPKFPAAPTPSILSFTASPEYKGAEVWLDEQLLGTVPASGQFAEKVTAAGSHTISIKKPKFRHDPVKKEFVPGGTVLLTAKEVELKPTIGYLRVEISPPLGASGLNVRPAGTEVYRSIQEETTEQVEGDYEYQATAPGYETKTDRFAIRAGETCPLKIGLSRAVESLGMQNWEEPSKWQSREGWQFRKGGNYVRFNSPPIAGSFTFFWLKRTGFRDKGKTLRWAVNVIDDRNLLYFEFDGKKLTRYVRDSGAVRDRQELSVPQTKVDKPEYFMRIAVTSDGLETEVMDIQMKRLVLDIWTIPGHHYLTGKFALHLPEDNEVWIRAFNFQPRK